MRAGLRKISASTWSKPAGTSGPLDSPRTHRQAEVGGASPLPREAPWIPGPGARGLGDWLVVEGHQGMSTPTTGLLQPETKTLAEKPGRQPASELARGPGGRLVFVLLCRSLPWRAGCAGEAGSSLGPSLRCSWPPRCEDAHAACGEARGEDTRLLEVASPAPSSLQMRMLQPHLKYNLTTDPGSGPLTWSPSPVPHPQKLRERKCTPAFRRCT